MKKITAIICSLIMTCTVLASCSNSAESNKDSSSSKTTSSAVSADEDSKSEDGESKDSKSEDGEQSSGSYAEAYTQKLRDKNFSLVMTIESDLAGKNTMTMEYGGENYHMCLTSGDYVVDTYLVDSKMYILDSENKAYSVLDYSRDLYGEEDPAVSSFGIQEDFEFVGSEETEDGLVCETYKYVDPVTEDPGSEDSSSGDVGAIEYKYYFDKESGDLKKIDVSDTGITQTVTVDSFTVGSTEVALPDLTGWTEESMFNADTLTDEGTESAE
ncbi:MAG: hypothetical protein J5994_07240 [Ruminococcus sp.]|nr:hypothetical protein [Ruminococcus sp.]